MPEVKTTESQVPNEGTSHWYDFGNKNDIGSWNKAVDYAQHHKTFGKQFWHVHAYGEECEEGCHLINPDDPLDQKVIQPETTG